MNDSTAGASGRKIPPWRAAADNPDAVRPPTWGISRRRFAAMAGSAALLPLLPLPAGVRGASLTRGPADGGGSTDSAFRSGAPELAAPPARRDPNDPPGTGPLLDYIRALYADRLREEDLEVVRERIADSLRSAAAIREVPLANADEPAFTFQAWRDDDELAP